VVQTALVVIAVSDVRVLTIVMDYINFNTHHHKKQSSNLR